MNIIRFSLTKVCSDERYEKNNTLLGQCYQWACGKGTGRLPLNWAYMLGAKPKPESLGNAGRPKKYA